MTDTIADSEPAQPTPKQQYKAAKDAFPKALRHVWPYMALGLLIGFGLLGFSHLADLWIIERPYMLTYVGWLVPVLGNLADGFIVASVAVLFYEWGAEAKELTLLTRRMVDLVDRDLEPIISAVAHDAVFRGLDVLEPRMGKDVAKAFRAIFEAFRKLSAQGDWNYPVFYGFAVHSLEKLSLNIEKLADLSAAMRLAPRSKPDATLHLPRSSAIASRLLCDEIQKLSAGGSYSALSDVDSWRVLEQFEKAQEVAVTENGVHVRRVFLLPEQAKRDTGSIVTRHLHYATDWTEASARAKKHGRYEVRIADEALFSATVKDLSVERHFGVFATSDKNAAAIAFQVKKDDLSVFTLIGVTESHELMRDYERLWERLKTQTPLDVANLLLAAEIRALRHGGRYHVVSDFASWQTKGLNSFHKACLEGARDRALEIRRVFVAKDGDDINACRALLKRHVQDQKTVKGDGSYEVRICHERDALATFGEKWQFGFFVAPGTETEDIRYIVAESSKPGLADFYMWSAEEVARVPLFEAFWLAVGMISARYPRIEKDWPK